MFERGGSQGVTLRHLLSPSTYIQEKCMEEKQERLDVKKLAPRHTQIEEEFAQSLVIQHFCLFVLL